MLLGFEARSVFGHAVGWGDLRFRVREAPEVLVAYPFRQTMRYGCALDLSFYGEVRGRAGGGGAGNP